MMWTLAIILGFLWWRLDIYRARRRQVSAARRHELGSLGERQPQPRPLTEAERHMVRMSQQWKPTPEQQLHVAQQMRHRPPPR